MMLLCNGIYFAWACFINIFPLGVKNGQMNTNFCTLMDIVLKNVFPAF